jgi:alkylation response protein AidB-like acyl-CoA dehydrogenase
LDFKFTGEQEAFRTEVRRFIDETLTPEFWAEHRARGGGGSSPEFSRRAAEANWLAVAWPEEYGGAGRSYIEQMIYMEEMAYAGAPQEHHRRAVQQVGPSIILFGDEDQKRRYLPKIASGELSFAMGLSEADAGSDLASAQTSAKRDGDFFIVNGEKKYTSGAHYSDLLWTVVRTDPEAPKHRGISMLVVPLDADGVSVEPLIDLQGQHHFNKVFLEDVRVPADHIVGDENRGWYVNATTMDFERSGIARIAGLRRILHRTLEAQREAPLRGGHIARRIRLAEHAVATEVSANLAYRVTSMQTAGGVPNYEVSITKLLASETNQAIHNNHVGIAGLHGQLSRLVGPDDEGGGTAGNGYLAAVPATIAQGSSEIQRNVIATRGLGLPRG